MIYPSVLHEVHILSYVHAHSHSCSLIMWMLTVPFVLPLLSYSGWPLWCCPMCQWWDLQSYWSDWLLMCMCRKLGWIDMRQWAWDPSCLMLCNYNSTDAHICCIQLLWELRWGPLYFYHYSCAHIMPMAAGRHAFQPYKLHDRCMGICSFWMTNKYCLYRWLMSNLVLMHIEFVAASFVSPLPCHTDSNGAILSSGAIIGESWWYFKLWFVWM